MAHFPPAPPRADAAPPRLRRRLLPPLALFLLLLLFLFSRSLDGMHEFFVARKLQTDRDYLSLAFARSLEIHAKGINALLESLALDPETTAALAARDAGRLVALHRARFDALFQAGILTHLHFIAPERTMIVRLHDPSVRGDRIDRHTLREAARTGRTCSGLEIGPFGGFVLRSVKPVAAGGRPAGFLEVGREVGELLETLPRDPDLELALLIRKDAVARESWEAAMRRLGRVIEWERLTDEALVHATTSDFPLEACLERVPGSEFRCGGVSWRAAEVPVADAAGRPLARLLLARDVTGARERLAEARRITFAISLPGLIALLIFTALLLGRSDAAFAERERLLLKEQQRYRALFENASSGIVTWELILDAAGAPADLLALEANAATERHTGLKREAIVGRRLSDFITGHVQSPVFRECSHAALTECPARIDRYVDAIGRHLDLSIVPLGGRRMAVILNDVTEERRADEERRERLDETERLNRLMVAREERLVELKDEVNRLAAELGRPPRYPSARAGEGA